MSKKAVSKEIRRNSKAEEKECYVCDETIVETHHIVKVSILTGIVLKFNTAIQALVIPVVALCPNHHHKLHCLMGDINREVTITEYEKEKYKEIVDMAEYIDNEAEYSDVYNYAVDKIKNIDLD